MSWNWVDILIASVLVLSMVVGFRDGFVRIVVGFGAAVVGFLAASWFHGAAAGPLLPYVKDPRIANLLGFLAVLLGVIAVGALIAFVLTRTLKLVGLSFVNRSLGALLGAVRGFVFLAVLTMVLMAFLPRHIPAALQRSQLAPYLVGGTRALSELTPYRIKRQVERYHEEFRSTVRGLQTPKLDI